LRRRRFLRKWLIYIFNKNLILLLSILNKIKN
jgi:hypothetical protein